MLRPITVYRPPPLDRPPEEDRLSTDPAHALRAPITVQHPQRQRLQAERVTTSRHRRRRIPPPPRGVNMLKGLWYWTGDIGAAIRLALDIGANTMILKAAYHDPVFTGPLKLRQDFPRNAAKCRAAALLVAAEVFSLPRTADKEGRALAAAVRDHGAASAVVNAETPHEDDDGSGVARPGDALGGAAPPLAAPPLPPR